MASQTTVRRVVLTGAIAAVTATGAWYGAGLKTQQQGNEAARKRREATVEEQVALLEMQRSALVAKRIILEKKLAEIEARRNGVTREESKAGRERRW